MATNQNLSIESILSNHGYASIDAARVDNVIHACGACGSIKVCTPAPGQSREEQRDVLMANFDIACCEDGDEHIL